MFPKFLLSPSVFPPKRRDAGASPHNAPTRPSIDQASKQRFLEGHVSCIRCSTCAAHLCLASQIISKGFTGRHGRAYLVSAQPTPQSPSDPAESLPNTVLQSPVSRNLVTGAHTVSDFACAFCGSVLGWKYVGAEEESQRYKVGKFILETKKVITTSAWDSTSFVELVGHTSSGRPRVAASKTALADVEFDSQDEDECEDLFSGIWTPGLAMRRRNRRLGRHPSAPVTP